MKKVEFFFHSNFCATDSYFRRKAEPSCKKTDVNQCIPGCLRLQIGNPTNVKNVWETLESVNSGTRFNRWSWNPTCRRWNEIKSASECD